MELQGANRRLSESVAEKETLLKELYHRTKNNMNVISSLINLQASSTRAKGYRQLLDDLKGRINAMALVHEKLYKSVSLSRLDISGYIRDLANSILRGYKKKAGAISLGMDIEPIGMDIETAIPCGLIINELMSNALKYAFPGKTGGKIEIGLHARGGHIELGFRDDGVGLPKGFDPAKAGSMGLKIVKNLAAGQLQGTIETKNNPGAEYKIRFRVDKDGQEKKIS